MAAREGAGEGRRRGARHRLRQHGCTGRLRHGGALFGRTPTCGRRSRRWPCCASRGTPIRAARSPRGVTRRPASSRRVWRSGPLRCGAIGSASPTFRPWRTPATTRRPHDVPAPAGVDCVILPSAPRFIRDPLTSNAATSPARGAWCSRRAMPARAAGSCPRLRPCGASSSSNVVALFFRSMNGELRTVDIATIAASLRVAAGSGSRGAATLHHGAEDRARRATRQAVHGAEIKSGEVRASTPSPRMRFGPRLVKSMTWPTVCSSWQLPPPSFRQRSVLNECSAWRGSGEAGDRERRLDVCPGRARHAHKHLDDRRVGDVLPIGHARSRRRAPRDRCAGRRSPASTRASGPGAPLRGRSVDGPPLGARRGRFAGAPRPHAAEQEVVPAKLRGREPRGRTRGGPREAAWRGGEDLRVWA